MQQFSFDESLFGGWDAKIPSDVVQGLREGCDLVSRIYDLSNHRSVLRNFMSDPNPKLPGEPHRQGKEQWKGQNTCAPQQLLQFGCH